MAYDIANLQVRVIYRLLKFYSSLALTVTICQGYFFRTVTHKASGGSPRAAACNLIGFNFCLSAARRSLYSKAIQEGYDLRSGAIRVGAECGVGGSLGDVLLDRPQYRISIVGGGLYIGKGIGRTRCRGLLGTPQECDDLGAGAGHVGGERGVAGALGDAILHRPQHSVVIIAAHRDVGEGHGAGFGFGTASCSPQEGHGLRSGAGSVRTEGRCGGAFRDAVLNSPIHSFLIIAAGGYIRKHAGLRVAVGFHKDDLDGV